MGFVITAQETILDEFNVISLGTNCSQAHPSFWARCLGAYRGCCQAVVQPVLLCAAHPPLPAVPMCHQVIRKDEGRNKMTLLW